MKSPLPPPYRELLSYLDEIGYRDLYLRPSSSAPPGAPEPSSHADALPTSSPGELTPEARSQELEALAVQAAGCTRCKLSQGRKQVVFGTGHHDAELMFIGEGPGAEEDRQGLPFVGAAGKLLTRIIQAIELERDQVYIANIVKCRPPGNRDPEGDEVAACRAFLERQIDLIRPKVIVALGRVAAQCLLATETPLGKLRGRWYDYRGARLRVTYHPAALLRSSSYKRPTWEDMQQVRDELQRLA